jgi:predicted site-specific integrase-resolvase
MNQISRKTIFKMWEVGKIRQKLNVGKMRISDIPIFKMMLKKVSGNIIGIDNQWCYILFPTFLLYFTYKNK